MNSTLNKRQNQELTSDVIVLVFIKKCPNEAYALPQLMKYVGCDVMSCCRFGSHACTEAKGTCDPGGQNYCGQSFCSSCLGKINIDKKTNGFIRHCRPSCKYYSLN